VSVSGNSLQVQAQARFNDVASTMGHNQQAVAANLQTLFDNGSDMGGGFSALSKLSDAQSVQKGFNTLSGQTLGAIGAFRFNSSRTFVNNMNSGCVAFDGSGDGSSCTWARAAGGTADQDATTDALGYHASAQIYQLGTGIDLSPNWQLSASAAYEASKFRDDDRTAKIKGSTFEAGAELRYHNGPLEISGAVDGAYGWYDSHRTIAIGDIEDVAASNPNEWQVGAHAQASYTLSLGKAYVKPFADLHAIYVHADGYTETGSSPFNLAVADQGNLGISGAAGVELGGKFKVGSATIRPFVSAAWERLGNNDWTTTARFAGQPDADPFDAQTAGPSQLGRFNAGLDILGSKKIDLSLQYSTELGDHYSSQAGVARVTFHF
jgi:outer membrane autotransporter protein